MHEQLRAEIQVRVQAEFAPAVQRFAEEQTLSDDEYVERYFENAKKAQELAAERGHPMPTFLSPTREQLLAKRNGMLSYRETLAAVQQKRIDEILPYVIRVREEEDAHGPLSESQYHEARHRQTRERAERMLQVMRERLDGPIDPFRKEILSMLVDNAEQDLPALDDLMKNPTEEGLKQVRDDITARIGRITEFIQEHRKRPNA